MKVSSPKDVLQSVAAKHGLDIFSSDFAEFLDSQDGLKGYRERFAIPKRGDLPGVDPDVAEVSEECVYMCSHSLGLKPLRANHYVQQQLDKWARMGANSYYEEPLPAVTCDKALSKEMGKLVGAYPSTVCLMNGLTVNLHLLLLSFYQPTQTRYKILIEGHAFPSDRYAMKSQAELRGFDPNEAVLEIHPRSGEHTIRTEDILEVLRTQGSSIAVVCLSGVQYYTGQKFDMGKITKAAQDEGCLVGWDLAHAIGNVPIQLDDWGVDFACWCTYKYLNSGPGCIGGAYVNKRHETRDVPHLRGWWSNKESTRFQMRENCDVAGGVDGFRLCTPPPILVAVAKAGLEIFAEVGMDRIVEKQFLLTGYLEFLVKSHFEVGETDNEVLTTVITPEDPSERGCQLSLIFSYPLNQVFKELQKRGVVCDVRHPNVMRITPVPLYNSFQDVYRFIRILQHVITASRRQPLRIY